MSLDFYLNVIRRFEVQILRSCIVIIDGKYHRCFVEAFSFSGSNSLGVRTEYELENYDWVARWSYRIESWFSPFADLIICNSESGREYAAAKGFPRKKMVVIPNGIDTTYFKPDPVTRLRGRAVWGISESDFLIGLVARLDPIKGHENLFAGRQANTLRTTQKSTLYLCW